MRALSGIYFRVLREKVETICFEDLTEEEQDKVLEGRSYLWLKNLSKALARTINTIKVYKDED